MKFVPGDHKRNAPVTSEASAGAGVSATQVWNSESVKTSSAAPSHLSISSGSSKGSDPSTTRSLGTIVMLREDVNTSSVVDDPPSLSPTAPARENENGDEGTGNLHQHFIPSSRILTDLADRFDQMSLKAGNDMSSASSSGIEPIHSVGPEVVDAINRRWREARGASHHRVSHQEQAFSDWRQDRANNDRNVVAEEVQALSDESNPADSGSNDLVIIDRDVSGEEGETTNGSETFMVDSEPGSDESNVSNDCDENRGTRESHKCPDSPDSLEYHKTHEHPKTEEEEYKDCCREIARAWVEISEEDDFEHDNRQNDEEFGEENDSEHEKDDSDENHQNDEGIGPDIYKMFYRGVARLINDMSL